MLRIFILSLQLLNAAALFADVKVEQPNISLTAQFICNHVFGSQAYNYDEHFSPSFRQELPEIFFRAFVQDLLASSDHCAEAQEIERQGNRTQYRFISSSGNYIMAIFALNDDGLIDTFLITGVRFPSVVISNWDDAFTRLNSFGGRTSLVVKKMSDAPVRAIRENEMAPLASGFKLYVLGALADAVKEGNLEWREQYPITDNFKSLYSMLETWAAGTMVSLYNFAEYMIKISDNTATDHLINILGRNSIEQQLINLKNDHIEKNLPLLTTAEMFKLKWAAPVSMSQTYLSASASQRRNLLDNEIAAIPLSMVGTNGVSFEHPALIRDIEWFGSTTDLCEAMEGLKQKESPEVLKALSQNLPLLRMGEGSHWQYAGFKGGGEPGVITMTYLLKSQSNEWGCVSMTWHDENNMVNEWIFMDLVEKVLMLAEQEIQ